jgi:membrane protease YdiL (CAAX protease family)
MNENFAILFVIALNAILFVLRRSYIHLFQSDTQYYLVAFTFDFLAVAAILYLKRGRIFDIKRLLTAPRALLFLLGGFGIALLFKGLYYHFLGAGDSNGVVDPTLYNLAPSEKSWLQNFATLVEGPIKEEVIYRLGLLGALSVLLRKPSALILSSALFALSHYWVYPLSMMIPLFVFGLVLGLTYLTLGLPWSIALHLILNNKSLIDDSVLQNDIIFYPLLAVVMWGVAVFVLAIIKKRNIIFLRQ